MDFKCDSCHEYVDLNRQTLISSTPNILIVHLKRGELTFLDNNTRAIMQKVNDYYKFPEKLDLEEYSYHKVLGDKVKTQEQIN